VRESHERVLPVVVPVTRGSGSSEGESGDGELDDYVVLYERSRAGALKDCTHVSVGGERREDGTHCSLGWKSCW
jgi:hypothetical protein